MLLHHRARSLSFFLTIAILSHVSAENTCKSFGVDFQDAGTYFQNSQSTEPFTFVSEFHGCRPDICFNILVDPWGNQVECSETYLTPDDADQLSTCPTLKNQLVSGAWSVIMISNNAEGEPIAYQREFNLTVGPQQTEWAVPTVTVPVTETPLITALSTIYNSESTVTVPPSTVYAPSRTIQETKTIILNRVTITTVETSVETAFAGPSVNLVKETQYVTASCTLPTRQSTFDRLCSIAPKIQGAHAEAIQKIVREAIPDLSGLSEAIQETVDDALANAKAKLPSSDSFSLKLPFWRRLLGVDGHGVVIEAERSLPSRRSSKRRDLVKRAPDQPVVTVNIVDPALFSTVSTYVTAPPSTTTVYTTVNSIATVTPPPIIIAQGEVVEPAATVTAPPETWVVTRHNTVTTTVRKEVQITVTVTSETTPEAAVRACREKGGHF